VRNAKAGARELALARWGRLQRQGDVIQIVDEHLTDLSPDLKGGDNGKYASGPDRRDGQSGRAISMTRPTRDTLKVSAQNFP